MGFNSRIAKAPNPLHKVKKRFTRYLIINSTTGALSFVIALPLLHYAVSLLVSLLIAVAASGLLNYGMLEFWAFPQRSGRLSWQRLLWSSIVGAAAFAVRYFVLLKSLDLFRKAEPCDNFLALILAYLASFSIGYIMRSRMVFK